MALERPDAPVWKRLFWRNTLSNYVRTITRMLLGLVLFRLLFENLDARDFGFWSLLWSLFGYGVLLDFGFGFTAQKAVAEKTATGDIAGLNRLISTIFWTFIGLAALLALIFLVIRDPFLASVETPPEKEPIYNLAYLIFFGGLALVFPLGLFPEMLRGLQRLDIANWINTGTTLINFIGIVIALWLKLDLVWIVLISVVTTVGPNLIAAFFAVRMIPGLQLSPRHFHFPSVKAQMGFSFSAYLITFSNLLMARSDQLVIGLTLGLAPIALYQAGFKMAEMLNMITMQLQDALSPAAADLNARGNRQGLRELLVKTSGLTLLVSTPLYALSAVYLENLIMLLTGLDTVSRETWLTGQILLLAIYSSQITNSCAKRVLMMCGYEKRLLVISLVDALVNVGLSVILALNMGLVGVALGTLIPTILVGWLWVVPLTLHYLELPVLQYFRPQIQSIRKPLSVFVAILLVLVIFFPIPPEGGFLALAWRGASAGIPCLIFARKILLSFRG